MYHVYVIGFESAGFLKAMALTGPLRVLKAEAKALPGHRATKTFKAGSYHFVTFIWSEAAALRSFTASAAVSGFENTAHRATRFQQSYAFVCETAPSKDEMINLWRAARHAAAA
ncbi:hypothetical protein ACN2XU_06655 [Primorskyibacter sp. 2E107]|uniref:hypothetical protein n=1 Tax=Primorskyibacter sp. 2E107 TaxID=3403458 RepID=UPI003AF88A7E